MDVFEAVRTLLAVRSYRDQPVADDVLKRILEAGRLTGSAMNRQPWHFIVVRERERLGELARLVMSAPYIAQAPVAIAVAVEDNATAVSDATRALHSMMLTAWGEGVGSNFGGFSGLDDAGRYLGLPVGMRLLTVAPFGYPAGSFGRGKKERKLLREIAHAERFGEPFG